MERLTEDEMVEMLVVLRQKAMQYWDDADACYRVKMDRAGDAYARQCQRLQSAYAKLRDWPYEPEYDGDFGSRS